MVEYITIITKDASVYFGYENIHVSLYKVIFKRAVIQFPIPLQLSKSKSINSKWKRIIRNHSNVRFVILISNTSTA